jgi:2-dehydropantoate 2-reductase
MERDHVEYAILGAGAIGSILGAHLARSGHSVLMLARAARAQQIEQQGLRIRGLAEFTQAVPVLSQASDFRGADVLVVTTKTYGMEAALAPLRHAQVGAAFSLQNGLMKNEQLAAVFGADRVLGAVANASGEVLSSGEVLFTRNEQLCVGEPSGELSARVQRIARTIDAAGVRTTAVPDIQSLEWSKFAAWAGLMVLSVTTRAVTWKYLVNPDAALVLVRLVREVGALAAACHVPLSDQSMLPVASLCRGTEAQATAVIQSLGLQLKAGAPQHRMSTLQDLEAGRPLEVEETLGYAARKAAQMSLPLPLLSSCYALVRGLNRLREPPDAAT